MKDGSPYMTRADILRELNITRTAMNLWMLEHGFPRPLGRIKGHIKAWDRVAVYNWADKNTRIARRLINEPHV